MIVILLFTVLYRTRRGSVGRYNFLLATNLSDNTEDDSNIRRSHDRSALALPGIPSALGSVMPSHFSRERPSCLVESSVTLNGETGNSLVAAGPSERRVAPSSKAPI